MSDTTGFIRVLARCVAMASGHRVTDEISPDATNPVQSTLQALAGLDDGVEIIVGEDGFLVRQVAVPGTDVEISDFWKRLRAMRISSIYLPAWTSNLHMWRFLVITAMPPARVLQAGGLEFCLERADCPAIRIHEAPAPSGDVTMPFAPLPELEEINRRLAEPRSGDTVESLPFKKPASPDEEVFTYKKLTREIVRAFRPDGPDAAARALLLTWRRVAVVRAGRPDAGLAVQHVSAVMQRLEPLLRFAVLAQLSYTEDGRSVAAMIPDPQIAEIVVAAVVWGYPNVQNASVAVLRTARPEIVELEPVLVATDTRMKGLGHAEDQLWGLIREGATRPLTEA